VERQREADDHMRRYLHHLVHNTKSETLNGLIIVGAGRHGSNAAHQRFS
jgi:hypothetical protein